MESKSTNLFVYGSLRDSRIFKSVSGQSFTLNHLRINPKTLFAELALLARHRKMSPDNVYYYAVEDDSSRIEGFVIYHVPAKAMGEIDRYEGKRYKRQTVEVDTGKGTVKAEAYLVSRDDMRKYFGDRFHVNLIHELWLRKRIDHFLKRMTRPGEHSLDAELERQADRELLGTTERDLVISHYHSDAVSDYFLESELKKPRPSIKHLYEDEHARTFIDNYLDMVVRQVLLNQLENRIYTWYRYDIDHMRSSERFFTRSVSLLVALQMMNSNPKAVEMIIKQRRETMPYENNDLIDYVKFAVRAARSLFDDRVVRSHLGWIRSNLQPGIIPLGAEIELSNLGVAAVEPHRSKQKLLDPVYDGFRYFNDFRLDVLSWKTGGYIDDHSGSTDLSGRQGFLEFAPGRLNIQGELSRPATADPWLLNQLIRGITLFYNIKPHSLHLSFQLKKQQIGKQQMLPLEFAKCLLALGGGLRKRQGRRLWISRMQQGEITQKDRGEELVFARTSRRNWYMGDDEIADKPPVQAMTHVQQYKFIRLDKRVNYEPLILCLKGLQLSYNPGEYLTSDQLNANSQLRNEYQRLKEWAIQPGEISVQTIDDFLEVVRHGLMNEGHKRPVHKLYYINWGMNAIKGRFKRFNQRINDANQ